MIHGFLNSYQIMYSGLGSSVEIWELEFHIETRGYKNDKIIKDSS